MLGKSGFGNFKYKCTILNVLTNFTDIFNQEFNSEEHLYKDWGIRNFVVLQGVSRKTSDNLPKQEI